MSGSLRPHGLQHTRLPCPSPTPGTYSNSCPSNRWCYPTISSSMQKLYGGISKKKKKLFILKLMRSWIHAWDLMFSPLSSQALVTFSLNISGLPSHIGTWSVDWKCLGQDTVLTVPAEPWTSSFPPSELQFLHLYKENIWGSFPACIGCWPREIVAHTHH